MRETLLTLASAVCLSVGSAGPASAQSVSEVNARLDELFSSHQRYHAFFDKLKKAVAADDRETVASMIDYPFQARINGKAVKIRDRKHFVADYDQVVTPTVKDAITKQTYAALGANSQGISIGDGEIWFTGICGDDACSQQTVRIIAIND